VSFVRNYLDFARVLRAAGLPLGTGRVLDGLRALMTVGVAPRAQVYWALHAVFVGRREQHDVFDQAFAAFFRAPTPLDDLAAFLPTLEVPGQKEAALSRRVAEAMAGDRPQRDERPRETRLEFDAVLTYSDREVLAKKDFEQMSAEELRQARRLIARLTLPLDDVATRRYRPAQRGRIDLGATLRAGLRGGGDIALKWRRRRVRPPPLVCLCDISGSMGRYTRVLLHFLHTVTNDRHRVSSFVFGTRLTNITRHLRHRDVDVALTKVAAAAPDWEGGTRIGACLGEFNRRWSRRVLGQGAVVLLVTDGLDRDAGAGLGPEVERLAKSCRRLVWLNPLLRWPGFEPKARGIQAILPFVDELRPVHNLESLEDLALALTRPPRRAGPL
jgi:uncharacterized protein with von Willebrand factor type A (vWA) domain